MGVSRSNLPAINEMAMVGGRLCLDFINTTNWLDMDPVDDRLTDFSQALAWGVRVGLIRLPGEADSLDPTNRKTDPRVARLHQFRYMLRQLFVSARPPDPATLALFNQCLRQTGGLVMAVTEKDLNFVCRSHDLSWIEAPVAYSAAELLISPLKKRIKQCPGPRCGWLFLDSSPNNRRRWCSMATCGNKHKARQFYGRKKER